MKYVYKVYKSNNPYCGTMVIASSKEEAIKLANEKFPEYDIAIVMEEANDL